MEKAIVTILDPADNRFSWTTVNGKQPTKNPTPAVHASTSSQAFTGRMLSHGFEFLEQLGLAP